MDDGNPAFERRISWASACAANIRKALPSTWNCSPMGRDVSTVLPRIPLHPVTRSRRTATWGVGDGPVWYRRWRAVAGLRPTRGRDDDRPSDGHAILDLAQEGFGQFPRQRRRLREVAFREPKLLLGFDRRRRRRGFGDDPSIVFFGRAGVLGFQTIRHREPVGRLLIPSRRGRPDSNRIDGSPEPNSLVNRGLFRGDEPVAPDFADGLLRIEEREPVSHQSFVEAGSVLDHIDEGVSLPLRRLGNIHDVEAPSLSPRSQISDRFARGHPPTGIRVDDAGGPDPGEPDAFRTPVSV